MTRQLSVADVLALHAEAMALDGAPPSPLRGGREGLPESEVMRPRMAEHYEQAGLIRQVTLLAIGLSQDQPLFDGNKRTAYVAALVFLDVNGLVLDDCDEDLAYELIRVAEHAEPRDAATDAFERWLRSNVTARGWLADRSGLNRPGPM